MYSLREVALAHAIAAEKLLEPDGEFLNSNEAVIPVFINLLLQSLEITLKSVAIDSGLATEYELRDKKKTRNGHGVEELAKLIEEKNGGNSVVDLLLSRQGYADSNAIVKAMLFDPRFEPTRDSYAKRNITYCDLSAGDLQVIGGSKSWATAVILAAKNIDSACEEMVYSKRLTIG